MSPAQPAWALAALDPIHLEHLPLPAAAAPITIALVVAVVVAWPDRPAPPLRQDTSELESWTGRLSIAQVVSRGLAVGIVALAVVAGRLGADDALENIAPALVVGLAWPALVFVSAVGGPVWRWVDPWDGAARALGPDEPAGAASDVRLAVIPALAWAWYLAVFVEAVEPRPVGLVLGLYALVMVVGSLVVGRLAWLSRLDVFGLFFGWLARLPRGALPAWEAPRGAVLVLGALAGGLAFGLLRTSELWGGLNVVPGASAYATLAMLGSAAAVAGALWLLERWAARKGAAGSVVAAALPAVAGIVLAVALARSRAFTSLQLVVRLASDPFDLGWDLFGTSDLPILLPLGPLRLAGLQVATLVVAGVAGAVVLGYRVPRARRTPATLALVLLTGIGLFVTSLAPGL